MEYLSDPFVLIGVVAIGGLIFYLASGSSKPVQLPVVVKKGKDQVAER
jgi:hypothetical protein